MDRRERRCCRRRAADSLEGVISGLRPGDNTLEVTSTANRLRDTITLTNWPITGTDVHRPAADALRLHDQPGRAWAASRWSTARLRRATR